MCLLLMFFQASLAFPFFPLSRTELPSPESCPLYNCSKSTTSTDLLSTCVIYSEYESKAANYSVYTGIGCKNYALTNNFCDLSSLDVNDKNTYNVKCTQPAMNYSLLYPGEKPCWSNAGCINGKCVDYTCVGKGLGATCKTLYDCQPGLTCLEDPFTNSSTCEDLFRPNEGNCSTDAECVNNAGCDYDSEHQLGLCRPYFSVDIGGIVLQCNNFISMLCKYLQCAPVNESNYVCVKPSTSPKQPQLCVTGQDCADKSLQYYSQCVCGVNANRHSFCQPFPGDSASVALLGSLKQWVNSKSILACVSDQRWEFTCMMKWEPKLYDNLKFNMLRYLNYTAIQENSQCVKDIFTYLYWDAQENLKISSFAAVIVVGWTLWV